jgi:tartrate dehydratase alpha subunit/fumarate hydratase class I-like protein
VEALRYRAEDVARQLSKKAVREARARELAQELLNSTALTEYFEEHEAEKVGGGDDSVGGSVRLVTVAVRKCAVMPSAGTVVACASCLKVVPCM